MILHWLKEGWAWFQWIAQIWDPVAFLVIMALGLRAVVLDRRAYRKQRNDREVVVTMNSLLMEPGALLPTLRIRNLDEPSILDAMGQSRAMVDLLLEAARRVVVGEPVLSFLSAFDARETVHEITNQLSTMWGGGFVAQEISGVLLEHSFIFAITCEREPGAEQDAVNVRVQLILEKHLERLPEHGVEEETVCCWNLAEPKNPRYQTRSHTLAKVVAAYRAWKKNTPGSELIAVGRVFLVPPATLTLAPAA